MRQRWEGLNSRLRSSKRSPRDNGRGECPGRKKRMGPCKLELTEKPLLEPLAGYVRIRVEACGVCHSDSATVEGILPIEWPRVPGHEAVGRIDAIGEDVQGWAVGQRGGGGL